MRFVDWHYSIMQVRASLKHFRLSPRKTRLVLDTIRGLPVDQAAVRLRFLNKRAALPLAKLLSSAAANAKNNFDLQRSNLYIKEIFANDGPTLHRWRPRAHGRATPIRKRSSHIEIVLEEIKPGGDGQVNKKKSAVLPPPVAVSSKPTDKNEKISASSQTKTAKEQPDGGESVKSAKASGKGPKTAKGFFDVRRFFNRKSGGR